MNNQKTYAILYLRPDGWWVAGEGWTERVQAKMDAEDQMDGARFKVVVVGSKIYQKAKELEAAES